MHAEHADELPIRPRIRAETHQGVGNRVAEGAGEPDELVRGIVEDDAAAGVNHRSPGGQDEIERLSDLPRVTARDGVVGPHRHRGRVLVGNLEVGPGHVLGDVHDNRTGTSGGGHVECLLEGVGQLADILDEKVVLDARTRDPDAIDLLKCVAADRMGGYLSGNHHHRDRVHVRGRDAGDRVRGAGTRRDQDDAGLARGAGVAVRHVRRALLVANKDVLDVILLVDLVVDVEHGSTGIAEEVLHPFVLEKLHDDL